MFAVTRPDDARALVDAHVVRLDEILKEKVGEEEVAEVGHANGLLEAVLGVGGLHGVGEVDGRVADSAWNCLESLGVPRNFFAKLRTDLRSPSSSSITV